MNFKWFMVSWLIMGFIAGLIKIFDRDFNKIHQGAINKSGLGNPPNPKLFSLAMSTLFGYIALYIELKYRLSKRG